SKLIHVTSPSMSSADSRSRSRAANSSSDSSRCRDHTRKSAIMLPACDADRNLTAVAVVFCQMSSPAVPACVTVSHGESRPSSGLVETLMTPSDLSQRITMAYQTSAIGATVAFVTDDGEPPLLRSSLT